MPLAQYQLDKAYDFDLGALTTYLDSQSIPAYTGLNGGGKSGISYVELIITNGNVLNVSQSSYDRIKKLIQDWVIANGTPQS